MLLERENDTLHAKLQTLTAELARLRGDAAVTAQHALAFRRGAGTGRRPSRACRASTSCMSSPRTTGRVRSAAAPCAR